MKIFIDTANVKEIEDGLKKGVIAGITTNPSILSKEPKTDFIEHIKKITTLCTKYDQTIPLSVEVLTDKVDEMVGEAVSLVKKIGYKNINIKIPLSGWNELEVINELANKDIKVNCTCLFNESQCILAGFAGAKYVSLFRGRMKDVGIDPDIVIANTRKLLDDSNLDSEIIIGSIRNPREIIDSFLSGAHIVTAGSSHIKKLAIHPKTTESVNQFLNDFKDWLK